MAKAGIVKTVDRVREVMKSLDILTNTVVMVGVPAEKGGRREGQITNAELAYIHDKGAPDANIPARPFMEPGIRAVQDQITAALLEAGKAIVRGTSSNVTASLTKIGIIATRSIKLKISEGIPPPLAPSTIRGRIYRVKSKKRRQKIRAELASGTPASRIGGAEGLFTPLVVTGQLRNAITFVLRRVKGKRS